MGTFLFWMGSVVFFGAKFQMDDTRLFSFFAYIIVIYLVFDVIKIVLAKQLKSKLTPLFVYRIKQVVHIIIVLFGVFFIFQGTFPEQAQKLENRLENRLEDRLK